MFGLCCNLKKYLGCHGPFLREIGTGCGSFKTYLMILPQLQTNFCYHFLFNIQGHFYFVIKTDATKFAATFIEIKVQGAWFNG